LRALRRWRFPAAAPLAHPELPGHIVARLGACVQSHALLAALSAHVQQQHAALCACAVSSAQLAATGCIAGLIRSSSALA
jgi:hypothetical protein